MISLTKIRANYRRTVLCLLLTAAGIVTAKAENHEKIFGLSGGYITKNTSAQAGVFFSYRLNPWLRISPNATYIFRHKGIDAFSLNADCHFTFPLKTNSAWSIYPIAGIGYWSWNIGNNNMGDTGDYEKDDDVSSRTQRFSLNMGAGLQYMVTSTLVLSVEAKYALMKHSSTDLFSFSIGYHF